MYGRMVWSRKVMVRYGALEEEKRKLLTELIQNG